MLYSIIITSGVRKVNGNHFGYSFWAGIVQNLTCQVCPLTAAILRPCVVGRESVIREGKKRKTTNAIYLTGRKGLPLAMSSPKSGEHHDTHDVVIVMQEMMADLSKANIRTDGHFLNADAGFDRVAMRSVLKSYGVVANICIYKRNGTTNDCILLDELLYRERYSIERTNAWIDCYRTILNRFDTTLKNWESWNYIAFSVLLLRKCSKKSLNHFINKGIGARPERQSQSDQDESSETHKPRRRQHPAMTENRKPPDTARRKSHNANGSLPQHQPVSSANANMRAKRVYL